MKTDRSNLGRRRVRRRKTTNVKANLIMFRVSDPEQEAIKRGCETLGLNQSDFLRKALNDFIRKIPLAAAAGLQFALLDLGLICLDFA
jgi:hypothetical protein